MDESRLLNGVLRSVLGGRGRRRSGRALRFLTGNSGSFWTSPSTLLTAAGVAWGIYETMQGAQGSTGSMGSAGSASPPVPNPGGQGAVVSGDALRIVRLAISAANADGAVSDRERAAVMEQARTAGVAEIVEPELRQPRPLAEIVAGVSDAGQRSTLYVLAFTIVRGDEQPGGAERIYLAQLANLLGLDPQTVQQLEQNAGGRIDAIEGPAAGLPVAP